MEKDSAEMDDQKAKLYSTVLSIASDQSYDSANADVENIPVFLTLIETT
jgi:hypothetical protein